MLKPGFWDKNFSFISILLYPFSLIYLVLLIIKKILVSSKKFKIPVICVGNIYVGGTGKTPLAIFLSNNLDNNKKPVIIKKNYKNHYDEYELIKSKTDLIVGKNRAAAIIEAIDNNTGKVIIDVNMKHFRPSEVDFLKGDFSKAKKLLRWTPAISTEELIDDMIDFELSNI